MGVFSSKTAVSQTNIGFFKNPDRDWRQNALAQTKTGFSGGLCDDLVKHFQNGGGAQHELLGDLHVLVQEMEQNWHPDCGPNLVQQLLKQLLHQCQPTHTATQGCHI